MSEFITSDGTKIISGHVLIYGKFPDIRKKLSKRIIVIGNYNIKQSLENAFSCKPTIEILPKILISIDTLFEEYNIFEENNTCSIHYLMATNINNCLIEISELIVNNEQTRFEYMINKGIDINGIEFMSYEEFAGRFFKELVNGKRI